MKRFLELDPFVDEKEFWIPSKRCKTTARKDELFTLWRERISRGCALPAHPTEVLFTYPCELFEPDDMRLSTKLYECETCHEYAEYHGFFLLRNLYPTERFHVVAMSHVPRGPVRLVGGYVCTIMHRKEGALCRACHDLLVQELSYGAELARDVIVASSPLFPPLASIVCGYLSAEFDAELSTKKQ